MIIIALIGRPNVGKSTLFNRLTKQNVLVGDQYGLTRDRQYGEAKFKQYRYLVVDSSGYEPDTSNGITYQMGIQTQQAILDADIVILMVDARAGLIADDKSIAGIIRATGKEFYVALNKCESVDKFSALSEFYKLGSKNLYPISATHGTGVLELISNILKNFEPTKAEIKQDRGVFAIIGKPNVGKSTLANTILGENRVLTDDVAGTTRDSIYVDFEYKLNQMTLVDTAGISRKNSDRTSKVSIIKTLKAIEFADVIVLIIDATADIASQDARIVNYAITAGKSIVLGINKSDTLNAAGRLNIKQQLEEKLYFLSFAPKLFLSAIKNAGVDELLTTILQVYEYGNIKIPTAMLNKVLIAAVMKTPPAYHGQFRPKLRYVHQGGSNPFTIIIHGRSLENVAKSYTRYLEGFFRKALGLLLSGGQLVIEYKNNENPFVKSN